MTKANLNFYINQAAHGTVHALKRRMPRFMVAAKRDLRSELSIGITTYIERYDIYFKPLYRAITQAFPEVRLTVAVNGYSDDIAHRRYLERLRDELCCRLPPNHTFVLHDKPSGLTTLWNEICASSEYNPILILNDDLRIYPWLRSWVESLDLSAMDLTLLNSTWSHFFVSPRVLQRVGAFDPNFPGIGFEDMDYTARAGLAGVEIANLSCPYIRHRNHQPKITSFDHLSTRTWGKYTSVNQEYFFSKWEQCDSSQGIYIKQIRGYVRPVKPIDSLPACTLPFGDLCTSEQVIYPDRMP